MVKYLFTFFFIFAIAKAIPQPKMSKNIFDKTVIQKATAFIAKKEGLTLVHTKGLGHKEKIIGYGDYICKIRYKNTLRITKLQADKCLYEATTVIYDNIKLRLPNLNIGQYIAIVSLVFNVGYEKYDKSGKPIAFYNSKTYYLIKNKSKNKKLIRKEWEEFNHVNGKVVDSLTDRRQRKLDLFFNN